MTTPSAIGVAPNTSTVPARGLNWAWALVLAALVNSALTASGGFRFGFTHDDLMNTHWGLLRSWGALLGDVFTLWKVSPVYRPAGVAFLKGVHALVAMDIRAWRVIYGLLLVSGTAAAIAAGARLSGRLLVGGLAGLLMGFVGGMRALYFGMGFVYDALAYLLTSLTLLAYLRAREQGSLPWAAAALVSLIFCLQAKEVGLAAVAFVVLWELVGEFPRSLQWLTARKLMLAMIAVGLVFAGSRVFDPGSVANQNQAYKVHASPVVYAARLGWWTQSLLTVRADEATALNPGWWTLAAAAVLLVLLRSRKLVVWGLLAYLIGVLPVAFIPQRGLETIVAPVFGLAVAAAVLLADAIEGISRGTAVRAGLTALVALGIVYIQGDRDARIDSVAFRETDKAILPALAALPMISPRPVPSDHIEIRHDPFEEMDWGACFLFRLGYGMPFLDVKRTEKISAVERADTKIHWRKLQWLVGQWVEAP